MIEGTAGTDPGEAPDLPIVGPRIYAKGQRGTGHDSRAVTGSPT